MQSNQTEATAVDQPVDPPVDPGYAPPPLEPVPVEDPFADLARVAQSTLTTQLQAFHNLPLLSRQSALARIQDLPTLFSEGSVSAAALGACGQTSLNELQENLFQLARSSKPQDSSEEEAAALRLFAQILLSESLRRDN